MRWTVLTIAVLALILVPFLLFEDQVTAFATDLASGERSRVYVAGAISLLLLFDFLLPVPSSIVSVAAGALLGFGGGAVVVWGGMTLGCVLAYEFGSRSSAAARRFVGDEGLVRAERLARDYGDYALVLCRPVPVLAEASVIFAGLVHVPWRRFLLLTSVANLGVALGYAAVGAFSMTVDSTLLAFSGAVALPGLAALLLKLWMGARVRTTRDPDAGG